MAARRKVNGEGTVFQRNDGRWCGAGYVLAADGTLKRVFVYGHTRQEANDKLIKKLADSSRGVATVKTTMTVAAYLTAWLETVAVHRIRPTTYTTYSTLIRRHLIPGLGPRNLGALTVSDVQTFLDRIPTICQCCTWGLDEGVSGIVEFG